MKAKTLGAMLLLLLGCCPFSDYPAASPGVSKWRVIWFPPNDTFGSWNWVELSHDNYNAMKIVPVDYLQKFPDEVRKWELGVVSLSDPDRKATVPLGNPHSDNSLDFSIWMPGGFRVPGELRDSKIDRLEAMGEGTFLCAILGDDKRYSNVARVTIRHDYNPGHEPVIRLTAIQPFGKNDFIKYIGAWLVPPTPSDPHLITTSLGCPAWEIGGTWRIAMGNLNGAVYPLPSGISWGEVYYVGYKADHPHEEPFRNADFLPSIEPFTQAKVRLRIADHPNSYEDLPLTTEQREYLRHYSTSEQAHFPNGGNRTDFKNYISDLFDIHTDKEALARFDDAFGQN